MSGDRSAGAEATNFNAARWLLDRQVEAGFSDQQAIVGSGGTLTYGQLAERVNRTAGWLVDAGLQPEQRVVLFMADTPELVTLYLAAMRMGAIPVPVSTMLRPGDLAGLLADSRARLVAASPQFAGAATEALDLLEGYTRRTGVEMGPGRSEVPEVASRARPADLARPASTASPPPRLISQAELEEMGTSGSTLEEPYPAGEDFPAFWLYTSGTTGTPKAAMHRHGSVKAVCECYATQVLEITSDDRCLSVAKAFFAYGLGNSVLFPLSVGATAILDPDRPTPEGIARTARSFGATLFFAGPTFFANMLRSGLAPDALGPVRLAVSAGEPLPAPLYERWTSHFGVDILDGLGMTETLHIFCSNRAGRVRPGTSGTAVPGYELRIVDEEGHDVPVGTPGTLLVRGPSTATGYWCRYDTSKAVFAGEWLRTGDTYVRDQEGSYVCLGRTNDMLKASGIWVAPAEVEEVLLRHHGVAQAVVVAGTDADGLEKPVAFVVLQPGQQVGEEELISYCRQELPSFKRPRRVVFVDSYPATATGKVRRIELRAMATVTLTGEPEMARVPTADEAGAGGDAGAGGGMA